MRCNRAAYACGIVVLYGSDLSVEEFAADLAAESTAGRTTLASIFFSQHRFDPHLLAEAVSRLAPNLRYTGCSTAGVISPGGYEEEQIVAVLLPEGRFAVATALIDDVSTASVDSIVQCVGQLRSQIEAGDEVGFMFGMLLIDGMSRAEEGITSALYWSLGDIPLIGGSAGDDLRFEKTTQILNGVVRNNSAVLILARSTVPFRVFKTDNFVPTDRKLVVTASDHSRRTVVELDAEPGATAYAEAIGLDPHSLGPLSFASHPVVVRVGGEYYCRSIQKVNDDGSLDFFCAIDDGIVLTVADPKELVEATREKLAEVAGELGGIDVVLGFDCVLRRLDAQNRQRIGAMSDLYKEHNVVGFGTYGEQYRSMHLNQTLTGIAFGPVPESRSD